MVCVQKFLATTKISFLSLEGKKSFPSFTFCFWHLDFGGFIPGTLSICALYVLLGGAKVSSILESLLDPLTGLDCGFLLLPWGNQYLTSIWEMKTGLCCSPRKRLHLHTVYWKGHHPHLLHLTHSSSYLYDMSMLPPYVLLTTKEMGEAYSFIHSLTKP